MPRLLERGHIGERALQLDRCLLDRHAGSSRDDLLPQNALGSRRQDQHVSESLPPAADYKLGVIQEMKGKSCPLFQVDVVPPHRDIDRDDIFSPIGPLALRNGPDPRGEGLDIFPGN